MIKPNRFMIVIILFVAILITASGCTSSKSSNPLVDGKINVITSFYTIYDITRNIGGEHVNVINLVPAGVEPHDWSPKSRDMDNISKSQLFIYNGSGFEGWVDDFISSLSKDSKLVTIEASHGIKLIAADPNAEHEEEEEAGHENRNAHNDEHNHDGNTDPHTWVSPRSAIQMAENIKNALIQVDEAHQADYEANYTAYVSKLTALDKKFTTELSAAPKKDIVVSHQAFAYLCRDYGLNQVAIMGLTPEAEPRGQDLLNITKFVKEHQVKYIFFEELVSDKLAKTLANEAGIDTLVLNPLEGLTEEAIAAGEDFVSTMENNLQNLLKALQ